MESPNHTLYIRNLNEKIHPNRMKMLLYTAFSRFGNILDIIAVRRHKLRGQAWIVFREVVQATEAKRKMNGVKLFDKEMDIHYANEKSDIIARLDKTFKPRPKRKQDSDEDQEDSEEENENDVAMKDSNKSTNNTTNDTTSMNTTKQQRVAATTAMAKQQEPPHNVLIAVNLPEDIEALDLEVLFKQYSGFVEVRLVKSRNVAFIEFQDIPSASTAKSGLDGFQLRTDQKLSLNFAKA